MTVNIKRGFNRIYIVLAALWALYCAVLSPLQREAEATRKLDQDILACFDDAQCDALSEQIWSASMEQWQLRQFYSWVWGFLLLAISVPPLAVYGGCRGAARDCCLGLEGIPGFVDVDGALSTLQLADSESIASSGMGWIPTIPNECAGLTWRRSR